MGEMIFEVGADGRIMDTELKLYSMKVCTAFIWLRIRQVAGTCVRGNETSAANICWRISSSAEQLKYHQ